MENINNCTLFDECANNQRSCPRCFNESLYKPHKELHNIRKKAPKAKEIKKGMDFENLGTKKYNQAIKFAKQSAYRQINSGAIKDMPGDMITVEELTASLAEFKERSSMTPKGAKVISIQKKWLDQIKKEAKQMRKDYFFLPFRYIGDDTEYVIMEYDVLLSYVETIQLLLEQNKLLRKKLDN